MLLPKLPGIPGGRTVWLGGRQPVALENMDTVVDNQCEQTHEEQGRGGSRARIQAGAAEKQEPGAERLEHITPAKIGTEERLDTLREQPKEPFPDEEADVPGATQSGDPEWI